MGIRKLLFKIYLRIIIAEIKVRHLIFDFENVNTRITKIDKRLIIPLLIKYGSKIGKNCDIESPIIINVKENYKNLSIGDNCYIGKNVLLDLKGKIYIKNNVTISMSSTILSHIDVGKSQLGVIYPPFHQRTVLEGHCYIGADSCILPGVKIGEGCIVGAGSLVNKDAQAGALVAGSPAKIIKKLNSNLIR